MTNNTQSSHTDANAVAALAVFNKALPLLNQAQKDFPKTEKKYQNAKTAIYKILTQVFDAYVAIRSDKDNQNRLVTLLDAKLDELKEQYYFPLTEATSLELKVLRYVLAKCDLGQFRAERQKAYATVLRKGYDALLDGVVYSSMYTAPKDAVVVASDSNTFDIWLIAMGGIEAARRGHKPKKEESYDAPHASFEEISDWVRSHIKTDDAVVINDEAFLNKMKQGVAQEQAYAEQDDTYSVVLVKNSDYSAVKVFTDKSVVSAVLGAQAKVVMSQSEINARVARAKIVAEEKAFPLDEALDAASKETETESEAIVAE